MLFGLGFGKTIDAFALELANRFAQACPIRGAGVKDRDFEKLVDNALNDIFTATRQFRTQHRLGIFKRARLAKKFQDELMRLGYAPDLVNRVTTALVTSSLSGK